MIAVYFLMRRRRDGPILPARLWQCNHEPDVPENVLDRPLYWRADIGALEVDPEELFDRTWSRTDLRPGHAPTHWRYAMPIGETRYLYEVERIRWAETHRREDPALQTTRRVYSHEIPLPNFDRENNL